MKYCGFCGSEIPENAKFCPSCGKSRTTRGAPDGLPQASRRRRELPPIRRRLRNKRLIPVIILAVLVFAALLLMGIYQYRSKRHHLLSFYRNEYQVNYRVEEYDKEGVLLQTSERWPEDASNDTDASQSLHRNTQYRVTDLSKAVDITEDEEVNGALHVICYQHFVNPDGYGGPDDYTQTTRFTVVVYGKNNAVLRTRTFYLQDDGTCTDQHVSRYQVDGQGNPTRCREYDENGNLLKDTSYANTYKFGQLDSSTLRSKIYDPNGDLSEEETHSITYRYN